MAVIVLLIFLLPYLAGLYLDMRKISHTFLLQFIVPLYLCMVPAGLALICLDRMLARIKKENVFVNSNIKSIRTISWCCYIVSVITGIACYFYLPYVFVSVIMLFCGLIVRVIKNVFAKAVLLQSENDYTI